VLHLRRLILGTLAVLFVGALGYAMYEFTGESKIESRTEAATVTDIYRRGNDESSWYEARIQTDSGESLTYEWRNLDDLLNSGWRKNDRVAVVYTITTTYFRNGQTSGRTAAVTSVTRLIVAGLAHTTRPGFFIFTSRPPRTP
jgi:hypothetical protein